MQNKPTISLISDPTLLEVKLPALKDLFEEVKTLREELQNLNVKVNPSQEWFDIKTACQLKGINYNTVVSNQKYQPNSGTPDAIICGRRRWRKETIQNWLLLTDSDIPKGGRK